MNPTDKVSGSGIAVYARWRPASASETAASEPQITTTSTTTTRATTQPSSPDLLSISIAKPDTTSTSTSKSTGSNSSSSWKSAPAFAAVLGPDQANSAAYDAVVAPALPRVLAGHNFSVFAYGHSGSGKTHTIIGPGGGGNRDSGDDAEPGLCLAAARELFAALDHLNTSSGRTQAHEKLGIGLGVFELRKNAALDLLSASGPGSAPTECHIRQGPDGRTHIRGPTVVLPDGRVRVSPLTQVACFDLASLRTALAGALARRAVGKSSVHDESSRTHAVVELEVVSGALVAAREALWDRQSELVPVGKRATDVAVEEQSKGYVQGADGKWMVNPAYVIDQERIDKAEAEKAVFEARVADAERCVEAVLSEGAGGGEGGAAAVLGARMVFVDLAGAEYHTENKSGISSLVAKQTPKERQEGRQINTDLLALKEVIRAWSNGSARVPFRASPLTMVLREVFSGNSGGSGRGDGVAEGDGEKNAKGSSSAMVVTLSPAAGQFAATLNSLKYGSLVGAAAA
ncbi:P-loop containing nucleoside triphosphate hydrolase protein [Microdochium bolleyi]|uniref:p-loop containing nucleoside triphosphate hydrolase protein n=1 Tax=Microdochium bolleyi TaxID=196109 RepID=A0A136IPG9_9PEZI|nr:P-loop containing nucleoside triphosphate hydrolase protein [Microdochium bolleyi]